MNVEIRGNTHITSLFDILGSVLDVQDKSKVDGIGPMLVVEIEQHQQSQFWGGSRRAVRTKVPLAS